MKKETIIEEIRKFMYAHPDKCQRYDLLSKGLKALTVYRENELRVLPNSIEEQNLWDNENCADFRLATLYYVLLEYYGVLYQGTEMLEIKEEDIGEIADAILSFRNCILKDARINKKMRNLASMIDEEKYVQTEKGRKCISPFSVEELRDLQEIYQCIEKRVPEGSYSDGEIKEYYSELLSKVDNEIYNKIGPILTFVWLELSRKQKKDIDVKIIFDFLKEDKPLYYIFSLVEYAREINTKDNFVKFLNYVQKQIDRIPGSRMKNIESNVDVSKQENLPIEDYLLNMDVEKEIRQFCDICYADKRLKEREEERNSNNNNAMKFIKICEAFKGRIGFDIDVNLYCINFLTRWIDYMLYTKGLKSAAIEIDGFMTKMWLIDNEPIFTEKSDRLSIWESGFDDMFISANELPTLIDPVEIINWLIDNLCTSMSCSNINETDSLILLYKEFASFSDYSTMSLMEFWIHIQKVKKELLVSDGRTEDLSFFLEEI